MDILKDISKVLEDRKEILVDASNKIWEYAELPYQEFKSQALLCQILKAEGFDIELGLAQMPTSFVASYGKGKVTFGFLGEYDALDTLSQEAKGTIKKPIKVGAPGHGCGHNVLGVGSLGAAIACKEYLKNNNIDATVKYFGCPAEEGAGSKQFMARAGVFEGVDYVYTWHPSDINNVQSDSTVAIMGANFSFKGISSHAGSTPHLGRSALDSAEMMSVGVNYLREHIIDGARIHYAYSDAGGSAPNVVQDRAVVKYEVRSPKVKQVNELFERVVNVAKGAALMSGTSVDYEITMAFSDYIPNKALAEIGDLALKEVGPPIWDEKDYLLAKAYLSSFNEDTQQLAREKMLLIYGEDKADEVFEKPLDSIVHAFDKNNKLYVSGSTDVGDVSYTVPTLNFQLATACIGNVGHTWQMTGQSGSQIALKGMFTAAKVMALSALRTLDKPDVIKRAKEIVAKQNKGAYNCPLPDSVTPPIGKY